MTAIVTMQPPKQAFDSQVSIFVSANAGAGKTRLLTDRVLGLLLAGVPPHKILCLTFTNSAAAEMASRVFEQLGVWVMASDEKLEKILHELTDKPITQAMKTKARSLFAQVLEAPEGLRIHTIHGFCQSLLAKFPLEAGVGTHLQVMDEKTQASLLRQARMGLYTHAPNADVQAAIYYLAQHSSELSISKMLQKAIGQKRLLQRVLAHGVELAIKRVWDAVALPRQSSFAEFLADKFPRNEKSSEQLIAIGRALSSGKRDDKRSSEALLAWHSNPTPDALALGNYVDGFFTEDAPRKRIFNDKAPITEAQQAMLLFEQERVGQMLHDFNHWKMATHTSHTLVVLNALLAEYEALKQQHGWMDYDDQIVAASNLLLQEGMSSWVLFKLDGGIDHILVDEAQDTSPEQWNIVYALTHEYFSGAGRSEESRSIFIVGDEKQSIFSFQGADPAGLGKAKHYFQERIDAAGKTLAHISRIYSFRSAPEILKAVDAVFSQPLASKGLSAEEIAITHVATREKAVGRVELWPQIEAKKGEENDTKAIYQLATQIADRIENWLSQKEFLPSKNRAVEAGDIMVLVRTRNEFIHSLVRALKRRNIPVAGIDRMNLVDNIAITDMLSLAQVMLLPEDDLTLASVLKSPMFDMSEEDLFSLCYKRGRTNLWQRLLESPAHKTIAATLKELRAKVDFLSPYDFFSEVLEGQGARKKIMGRMGVEYAEVLDEFLQQTLVFSQTHPPSMQGFLAWMLSSESEVKRDQEQAANAVRIMTVHAAKGLQAPIVILPDTVSTPRAQDSVHWDRFQNQPILWVSPTNTKPHLIENAKREKMAADFNEYRRQLYVALTRAEDWLIIYGAGQNAAKPESWYALIQSGLQAICTKDSQGVLRLGAESHFISAQVEKEIPHKLTAPVWLLNVPHEETAPTKPLTPSRLANEAPASASPSVDSGVFMRGALIHALLQHLPNLPEAEHARAATHLCKPYQSHLPQEQLQAITEEVLRVMQQPEFATIFSKNALAEVPVVGVVQWKGKSVSVSGQIDRLVVKGDEVWIVDFKSNQKPPASAGAIPAAYIHQLALYRCLLAAVYPQKVVRCALLWTAQARLDWIKTELLDEVPASAYI